MPVVTVQLWTGRSVNQKRRLVAAITEAMVQHADCGPDHLHVIYVADPAGNKVEL